MRSIISTATARNKSPTPLTLNRSAPAWLPLFNEFMLCIAVPITAPGFDAADRRASEILATAEAGPSEFEDALLAALRDKQAGIAARGRAELAELRWKAVPNET